MAIINVVTPTWADVFSYMRGKGWANLYTMGNYTNVVYRLDIGSLNTYRFYADGTFTTAPAKITGLQFLTLMQGYSEYISSYTFSGQFNPFYTFYQQKAQIISDPTTWLLNGNNNGVVYNDGVLFTGMSISGVYKVESNLYTVRNFATIGTKNANNQGVFTTVDLGTTISNADTAAPMEIEISNGTVPATDVATPVNALQASNELVASKICELLNMIAENVAGHAQLTDAAGVDLADVAQGLFGGVINS